jgi:IS30 family transposase
MTKNKHLTLDDRITIQTCLERGETFKSIAVRLEKDPSTISKEVRKHLHHSGENTIKSSEENTFNSCPLLSKPPYCCNACPKRRYKCGYRKATYIAKTAQKEYKELLVDSREGIPLNKEEFYQMDKIITEGLEKGQHIYHIISSNNMSVSISTVYRYFDKGWLTSRKIDLPRSVKFKRRKDYKKIKPIPKTVKEGRTYQDFIDYCQENDIIEHLEMDTVIGAGKKVLLTFTETQSNFFFARLLPNKTAIATLNGLNAIKRNLKKAGYTFSELFPVILTDNGGEFAMANELELDWADDMGKAALFYCDPMMSSQKPRVEKNHTLLRDILPKKTSFDDLTQKDINLICSHINSIKRRGFRGKSAFDLFTFQYSEDIAHRLGIKRIPDKQVIQSTRLLNQIREKKNDD